MTFNVFSSSMQFTPLNTTNYNIIANPTIQQINMHPANGGEWLNGNLTLNNESKASYIVYNSLGAGRIYEPTNNEPLL